MKKIALSLIFASALVMAAESNATAPKADANKTANADSGKGKALFAKCVSCHGDKAQNKALGKSEVIAGWDVAKLEEALKGYKAGTRNIHGMGGLMKGQVASMSDEDIKALAEYIHTLK